MGKRRSNSAVAATAETTPTPGVLIVCSECGASKTTKPTPKGVPRIPNGWKRKDDVVFCKTCWNDQRVLRAISFPIAGPVDRGGEPATWKDLRDALAEQWRQVTALSNWAMTQFYARDVRRSPGDVKMPPMPKIYLYPETGELFPALPSNTRASICTAVERKYRAIRYEVVWTSSMSLPNFRYPAPFVAHNATWKASFLDDGRPCVSLLLGNVRWRITLRGGARRRRQLAAFRRLVNGECKQGELAVYRVRAGSDGRIKARDEGTGQRVQYDVMLKLVLWMPRNPAASNREGTLMVRTTRDSLLVAVDDEDQRIWTWHATHIRRWVAEHQRRLQQWSDDSKAEQRPVPLFAERRRTAVEKQHHRMDTAVKEAVRVLVNYAKRRRMLALSYDDTERGFCDSFPWFTLRERLKTALNEAGIECILKAASEPTPDETP